MPEVAGTFVLSTSGSVLASRLHFFQKHYGMQELEDVTNLQSVFLEFGLIKTPKKPEL